ncbi:MAG: methyl-accepting chemotaxis protein [Rhodospirillales bacterium]
MAPTIRSKLYGLATLAVAAILVTAVGAAWALTRMSDQIAAAAPRIAALEAVGAARTGVLEIVLAALDSIVDKDEGAVVADRRDAVDDGLRNVLALVSGFRDASAAAGEPDAPARIADLADQLHAAIATDLWQAIETRADNGAFATLDDRIDGLGEALKDRLVAVERAIHDDDVRARAATLTDAERMQLIVLAVGGGAVLAVLFIASVVIPGVVGPILAMRDALAMMGRGALDTAVPGEGRRDEIGDMSSAVALLRDGTREAERLRLERQRADLEAAAQRAEAIERMARLLSDEVGARLEDVVGLAATFETRAGQLQGLSARTREDCGAVDETTGVAQAQIDAMAGAVDALDALGAEIAAQAETVLQAVGEASGSVAEAQRIAAGLSDATRRIGDVVTLIRAVAQQTNLLALNATIEAARAGEAGRGFAVVAGEVKNLASQTAQATEEIDELVQHLRASAGGVVAAIGGVVGGMGRVETASTAIGGALSEQVAGVQRIASAMSEARRGMTEVVERVTAVTASAQETDEASSGVAAAGRTLAGTSGSLRNTVRQVASDLRRDASAS